MSFGGLKRRYPGDGYQEMAQEGGPGTKAGGSIGARVVSEQKIAPEPSPKSPGEGDRDWQQVLAQTHTCTDAYTPRGKEEEYLIKLQGGGCGR